MGWHGACSMIAKHNLPGGAQPTRGDGVYALTLPAYSRDTLHAPPRSDLRSASALTTGTPAVTPSVGSISRRVAAIYTLSSTCSPAFATGDNDVVTLINSILGGYGLPKLRSSLAMREYVDLQSGLLFEYPRSWVKRANHLRPGLYVSDYSTGDKAVLEVFDASSAKPLPEQLVEHFVNPGREIGGDSRLVMPPARAIKAGALDRDGQMYLYVTFPSETITRSGYQIQRKNFGVAAERAGKAVTLVASSRADQCDKSKENMLQQIVASFRLQR